MQSRALQKLGPIKALAEPSASTALEKPDELSWRDYLLMLLRIDVGIEHALMVQYLYAAYSLGGDQVPYSKRKMVRHWQETLLSIAKEEMGHLLTVQNVLTCLGDSVSFEREEYPWDSTFYPFPFELEPLTLNSLAKYVYTEAPVGWGEGGHASESLRSEKAEIMERVMRGPIPPNPHVNSVSALFNLILSILSDPALIPDEAFDANAFAQQASWAAWARNHGAPSGEDTEEIDADNNAKRKLTRPSLADVIVVRVATRDDVIDALQQVAHQGEATRSEGERSHFRRFLHVYREFIAHFPDPKGPQPARDLPINPTTFRHLKRENGDVAARSTLIQHPASAKWAALFDLRYRLLLTLLAHTFRLSRNPASRNGPGTYQALTHRAFGEMYNLKALAEVLVRSPLDATPGAAFRPAGPPFQMPYKLELPESVVTCWQQYREILSACEEIRCWLRDPVHVQLSPQQLDYLLAMSNADREFDAWLETVLDAARTAISTSP